MSFEVGFFYDLTNTLQGVLLRMRGNILKNLIFGFQFLIREIKIEEKKVDKKRRNQNP